MIYKYTSINIHTIRLLVNSELYLGSYKKLNDPLEFTFELESVNNYPNTILLDRYYKTYYPHLSVAEMHTRITSPARYFLKDYKEQYLNYIDDKVGVTCFSKTYSSIKMWSHYANSHQGICIEFDEDLLYKSLKSIYNDINMESINYTDQFPVEKIIIDEENINFRPIGSFAVTKNNIWKDEEEVRLFIAGDRRLNVRNLLFDKAAIKGVSFGLNISDDDQKLIVNLIENSYGKDKVKFYRCSINDLQRKVQREEMKIISFNKLTFDIGGDHK